MDSEVFARIRDYLADQLKLIPKKSPRKVTSSTISAPTAWT